MKKIVPLVLVVVVVMLGSLYFYSRSILKISPSQTTKDWPIHSNDLFDIKYPPQFKCWGACSLNKNNNQYTINSISFGLPESEKWTYEPNHFSVSLYKVEPSIMRKDYQTVRDNIKEFVYTEGDESKIITSEVIINGAKGVKISGGSYEYVFGYEIINPKDRSQLVLLKCHSYDPALEKELRQQCEDSFSTFTFK